MAAPGLAAFLFQLNLPVGQVVVGALWRGQVVRCGAAISRLLVDAQPDGHSCLAGGDGLAVTTAVGACIAGPR